METSSKFIARKRLTTESVIEEEFSDDADEYLFSTEESFITSNIVQSDAQMHLTRLSVKESKISPYWLEMISRIERPIARNLFSQLTTSNALGYESSKGYGNTASYPVKEGTLLEYTIQQKIKHPNCVILMRCGEFYETYGTSIPAFVMFVNILISGFTPYQELMLL